MKLRLMFYHRDLVRQCKYKQAQLILRLLRGYPIHIYLCDDYGFEIEIALSEKFHLMPHYSHNFDVCRFEI